MSYSIVNQGGTIDALLKNGVPVAVLDSAVANDPIVLDDAFVPADKDTLMTTWSRHYNFDDYKVQLYNEAKEASDDPEAFEAFEDWTCPLSEVGFVVIKMKEILAHHTNKLHKTYLQNQITELV